MWQKIQGTYFKISALYFKIYALYFLPFQISDAQQLTSLFQNTDKHLNISIMHKNRGYSTKSTLMS